jgi:tyrosinase
MSNLFSSTGDPLFWIHHGGIDQLWYTWQKKKVKNFNDVVASTTAYGKVAGAQSKMLTSLNSEISMGVQWPSVLVKALIDPLNRDRTGILCYQYD